MSVNTNKKNDVTEIDDIGQNIRISSKNNKVSEAFIELERGIYEALETYSNVHRGSGHNSAVSTYLYEQARDIVLEYLGLTKAAYSVVFSSPRRAEKFIKQLKPESYQIVSSLDIGLPLGVRAIAIKQKALPKGAPLQSGGGTTKLMSQDWIIWANTPDKFEAGTPSIVNIIAFAKALRLIRKYGNDIFKAHKAEKLTTTDILNDDELKDYKGKELMDKLRNKLIGHGVRVPTMEGFKPYTNLDNSASTPTFIPIWEAFRQTLKQSPKVLQEIVHEARSICSEMLGAPANAFEIIFTSNTTESINLAAECLGGGLEQGVEPVVLNTLMEHSSNDLPWQMIPGCSLKRLSVDEEGFVDMSELKAYLDEYNKRGEHGQKRIKLVAISGASNVLGSCNDIAKISEIVHTYGAQLLVDAAQLIAHRKVDMEAWGIDYLAFSAHKVYAPFGCGVLIARKGLLNFEASERALIQSSGEENAGGITALGKALNIMQRIGMDVIEEEEQVLTKKILHGLSKIPKLEVYGIKSPDSPRIAHKLGVIVFIFRNQMADKVAKKLAIQSGIGVRNGCLCAHIIVKHILKISPGLEKFQRIIQTLFPKLKLPGVVRVSLGIENTEEDVDRLITALTDISQNPKGVTPSKGSDEQYFTKAETQKKINDFTRNCALSVYSS